MEDLGLYRKNKNKKLTQRCNYSTVIEAEKPEANVPKISVF